MRNSKNIRINKQKEGCVIFSLAVFRLSYRSVFRFLCQKSFGFFGLVLIAVFRFEWLLPPLRGEATYVVEMSE